MRGRIRGAQALFSDPSGNRFLLHLASFCRANESCVIPGDHDKTLVLEGRREVWLMVQNYLNLTPEQLMLLHPVKNLKEDNDVS